MGKCVTILWIILKNITVEPVSFLAMQAFIIANTAGSLGMYRVFCDKMFNRDGGSDLNNHSFFQCWNMSTGMGQGLGGNGSEWWGKGEVELQQEMATYSTVSLVTSLVPCGLANVFLGGIGDRRGRKGVILLNIVGYAISMVPFVIIFSSPITMPVWIIYVFNVVAGLTGMHLGLALNGAGYLSDIVKQREHLAMRMMILSAFGGLSSLTGPLIATALIMATSFTWTTIIAIGVVGLAFLTALLLLKTIIPKKRSLSPVADCDDTSFEEDEKKSDHVIVDEQKSDHVIVNEQKNGHVTVDELKNDHVDDPTVEKSDQMDNKTSILQQAKVMLIEAWRALIRKREGHTRAYLFIAFYIAFVLAAIDLTLARYVSLYLQKAPFSWTQGAVTQFDAATNCMSFIGSFVAMIIFKRCFAFSDQLIMSIALFSYTAKSVLFAFATETWLIYLSSAIGALSGLSLPCMQAFMATLMEPDELGKMFGFSSIFVSISMIVGTVAIGEIYKATVATYAVCVFVIGAALTASTWIISIWIYLDSNRTGKRLVCCRQKRIGDLSVDPCLAH